jgi:Tol biopolymer transport system component
MKVVYSPIEKLPPSGMITTIQSGIYTSDVEAFHFYEVIMPAKMKNHFLLILLLVLALVFSTACTASKSKGTQRVSVANDGSQADKRSKQPSMSADGRYVAFASDATNLVDGDNNGVTDVFVRDLRSGTTTRVSISSLGIEGDKPSYWPFISADGRYVTFTSEADNLVNSDTNESGDVFVHDMKTGETQMISVASDGAPGNDLSFWSSISSDGRYVVFMSQASNLVLPDTNYTWDIFLRDRNTGVTKIISNGYDGTQANSQSEYPVISADGRYVAFASDANNLVQGDTNGFRDVFEYDRETGKTILVSVASDGTQANQGTQQFSLSISTDGRYVAFQSLATNLVSIDTNKSWDIFVHDRDKGATTRVSIASDGKEADAGSYGVAISANGRYVAFGSNATDLVPADTNGIMDVFVHDRQTGKTQRVSISSAGAPGNLDSGFTLIAPNGIDFAYGPLITSDGSTVVFMSNASNLVADDTNSSQDIFINTR